MAKFKPLGSLVFGKITFNEKNLKYALKKNGGSKELKNWIDKTIAVYSQKYQLGHYLIFIKLNPKSTTISLRLDLDKYKDEDGNIVLPNNLRPLPGN